MWGGTSRFVLNPMTRRSSVTQLRETSCSALISVVTRPNGPICYNGNNLLRKTDLPWEADNFSHLFRLVVQPDNTYEVFFEGESKGKGNLQDDWEFLRPTKINDPNLKKPEDWVDEKEIDDPRRQGCG
mmetsp:Transcript_23747/g.53841  ORF Transcript_23747/g.53841 Transcript_23747/m.53841 type:complete len:128 (-) Transcript_23747:234-617(-)